MEKRYLKVASLVILGVVISLLFYPLISSDNVYRQLEKYKYVFGIAMKEYVDDVNAGQLTEAAIKGMLNDLDPHSTYLSAKEMKSVNEDMQGSFEGVGIQFHVLNDTITVVSPIKGGPSEALGIVSGDKIVEIDGQNAIGLPQDSIPKLLRGPKGTVVKVAIVRYGEKDLLQFDITRDKIPLYTLDYAYIFDNTDIGVIKINRFAHTTHKELTEAANNLKQQGMKKLVLDLRGNPGGLLDQAYMMADEFLSSDTIVYTKARREENNEAYVARSGQSLENIPLIVLIDAGSASASEIVSGSIQDNDRGLIVGTNSFGKGLVQRQLPMSDGSAIRLTIARYYTTSGRCIQRPYKDKANYRNLFGRLELEEGLNLEHALDKIKKEEANKKNKIDLDSIEIFYTKIGRPVLGGGGITPDYIIKYDTITQLSRQIRSKNLFNIFINNELNTKSIKEKYNNDFDKFNKDFKLNETMFKKLRTLAEAKDIQWNEEQAAIDKEWYETIIKSSLARMIWDNNKEGIVWSKADRQLNKATELFTIAEDIRNKRIKKDKR